jgi:predicted nuclease with TOPRIM domain
LSTGGDRQTLITKHADLTKELEKLRTELAAYSEQDPVEMEKKDAETQQSRLDADKFTDQILVMQSWLKQTIGQDAENFLNLLKSVYDEEYDEEEQGLREL